MLLENNKPTITVILVVLNEEAYVAQALSSVLMQKFDTKEIELIIVDGCSTDKTLDVVEEFISEFVEYFYAIKVMCNPKRILAAGWNLAIRESSAPLVLRFDGHSYLDEEYISSGVSILKKLDEKAVAVGGWMLHKSETLFSTCVSVFYTSPLGGGSASFRREPKQLIMTDTSLFAIYKKDVMLEAGLFDENQKRNQDIEFHKRLSKKGYKFYTAPEMKTTYCVRSNLKSLLVKAVSDGYWVGCSDGRYFRHMAPFFFLMCILLGCVVAMLSPSIGGVGFLVTLFFYFSIIFIDVYNRERDYIVTLLSLPIFFSYHVSYGAGTLRGILAARRGL